MKKALLWAGSIFMFLSAIAFFPSIASILMLLSGIVLLPLSALTKQYQQIVPSKLARICITIVLILASFSLAPVKDTNTDASGNGDTTTSATESFVSETQSDTSSVIEHNTNSNISQTETTTVVITTNPPQTETPKTETTTSETTIKVPTTEAPKTETSTTIITTKAPATEVPKQEAPAPESTFNIHFIDVGQADAALVECDGHYMLIDGGNKEDSNIIYTVLKNKNVSKLDIVIATHGHEDHVGGIPGAFNYTSADVTLCPITEYDTKAFTDFKKYATSNGGGITVPRVGDTYTLGSAKIKILGVNSAADANNRSIVLMITYGKTKFLFAGDAEREAEQIILNSGADLSSTVLKVGHHGSETSTTYPFLREIMPKYAVISVGENNSYGHPAENTLSRLRDADVKVYRTDMQGDIYCSSDGENVVFSVERNANADTLAGSEKPTSTQITNSQPTEQPTEQCDYVLNTNSKKFHYPSCSSAKQISETNKKLYTGTRAEIITQGYIPCGRCHP